MATYLEQLGKVALLAGFVCACAEVSLPILGAILGAGLLSLLFGAYLQATDADVEYHAALLNLTTPNDSELRRIDKQSSLFGLGCMIVFFGIGFFCVYVNHFWPMLILFLVAVPVGLKWFANRHKERTSEWRAFAERNRLSFTPGRATDRHVNARIEGNQNGRAIRIAIVNQTRPGRKLGEEVLIVDVQPITNDASICIDDFRNADSTDWVTHIRQDPSLSTRLMASAPRRIEALGGKLAVTFPRPVRTSVELQFHLELVQELASLLTKD